MTSRDPSLKNAESSVRAALKAAIARDELTADETVLVLVNVLQPYVEALNALGFAVPTVEESVLHYRKRDGKIVCGATTSTGIIAFVGEGDWHQVTCSRCLHVHFGLSPSPRSKPFGVWIIPHETWAMRHFRGVMMQADFTSEDDAWDWLRDITHMRRHEIQELKKYEVRRFDEEKRLL